MRRVAILAGSMSAILATGCLSNIDLDCLFGCVTPGERAGGAGCPSGERCSTAVGGLWFSGTTFGDDNWLFADGHVKTVVAGGTETLALWLDDVGSNRLTIPFAVDGGEVMVPPNGQDATVTLRVGGTSTAMFRDGTGALLDAVVTAARPIARTGLRPGGLDAATWVRSDDDRPWEVHTGASVTLTVALFDADGGRLVDEGLSLVANGASQSRWDTFAIDGADQPGTVDLTATSVGTAWPLAITVVSAVDAISPRDAVLDGGDAPKIERDASTSFCFRGAHGGALVLGGAFAFTSTGPVTLDSFDNCVDVTSTGAGAATLTATIDGVARTFALAAQ